jgi:DNA-directed RNA polymerase specialized sigma24 family protein
MPLSENSPYVDSLLLQALQHDDERALRHLFDTYYNKLFRAGIRWGTDSHLTQECIQAVFQDVWQYRKTLGPVESFEGYFSTESYEAILIEQEESEQQKAELRRALDVLTPRQKEVISMKYFDELSYQEIAKKTGLQVDTLYKILYEGIQRLKAALSVG